MLGNLKWSPRYARICSIQHRGQDLIRWTMEDDSMLNRNNLCDGLMQSNIDSVDPMIMKLSITRFLPLCDLTAWLNQWNSIDQAWIFWLIILQRFLLDTLSLKIFTYKSIMGELKIFSFKLFWKSLELLSRISSPALVVNTLSLVKPDEGTKLSYNSFLNGPRLFIKQQGTQWGSSCNWLIY